MGTAQSFFSMSDLGQVQCPYAKLLFLRKTNERNDRNSWVPQQKCEIVMLPSKVFSCVKHVSCLTPKVVRWFQGGSTANIRKLYFCQEREGGDPQSYAVLRWTSSVLKSAKLLIRPWQSSRSFGALRPGIQLSEVTPVVSSFIAGVMGQTRETLTGTNIAQRPRGLPWLQHQGCPVLKHNKRDCREILRMRNVFWFRVQSLQRLGIPVPISPT